LRSDRLFFDRRKLALVPFRVAEAYAASQFRQASLCPLRKEYPPPGVSPKVVPQPPGAMLSLAAE
jgi:hypothetical protein